MKRKKVKYTVLLAALWLFSAAVQAQDKLVTMAGEGRLEYHPYTPEGDLLPDFSYCGYQGNEAPIPNVKIVAYVAPDPKSKDDTRRIQAVIDKVASMPLDGYGFRGCILLKRGTYRIAGPLRITQSGIVLRGEGNSPEGTVLLATSTRQYNVIEIGRNSSAKRQESHRLTDRYVPSGTRVVHVAGASQLFAPGDNVMLHRPSTAQWIHAISMDSIPIAPLKGETPREAFERFRRYGEKTDMNGTEQWKEGERDLLFERRVTTVNGDEITLDIPLTNAFQQEFGGGSICKYTFEQRIQKCGVENMYGMSVYDVSKKGHNKALRTAENPDGTYCCDENHANTFIMFRSTQNAWARSISVEHFDCCVKVSKGSKFITGQDLSATNPISLITGKRRYTYYINGGQMCLFLRCYSSHHRHQFVLGASVAGPNAFVDGAGDMQLAACEPHHRWSAGCLWDNIVLRGPAAALMAANRGNMGTGHGWAGAQMVFWNCAAPIILVMQPPTAQNFAIGIQRSKVADDKQTQQAREKTFTNVVNASLSDMKLKEGPMNGTGWIESESAEASPASLFYQQLYSRLGMQGVSNVMKRKR